MMEDFFSRRLSELRTKKGVSARDMSLSLGQSAGYINKIENGRSLPSMMQFFYICDFLEITPKDFFDDTISNPSMFTELMEELKVLDDERLSHILAVVRDVVRGIKK